MSSSAVVVTTVPLVLMLLIVLPVVMLFGSVLVTQVHAFPAYMYRQQQPSTTAMAPVHDE